MEASALSAPVGLGRGSGTSPWLRLRSDEQLVGLFRSGSDEAFRVIHDRYRQRLSAYARQMLGGSTADAEDVMQDVFLRAYRALRVDERPVSLRAWLYRVAHNRCIDTLRRPVPPPSDIFEMSRRPIQDPLAAAERHEDIERLVADVRRLPDQQRSALLMREMDGMSYADLAAALETTVPAVKSLLVRARIGLVEAIDARDAACADIRHDLAASYDRGVRASGRARRHLRDCSGCATYRAQLRGLRHGFASLSPGTSMPGLLAKLVGLGGAGSGGAAAAGGAASGTSVAVGGGVATAVSVSKVAAVVCCAAALGGGAAEVRTIVAPVPVPQHHPVRSPVDTAPAVAAPAPTAASAAAAVSSSVTAPTALPHSADEALQPLDLALHPGAERTRHRAAAAKRAATDEQLGPGAGAAKEPASPAPAAAPDTTQPAVLTAAGQVLALDGDQPASGPSDSGASTSGDSGTASPPASSSSSTSTSGTSTSSSSSGSTSSGSTSSGSGSSTPATATTSSTSGSAPSGSTSSTSSGSGSTAPAGGSAPAPRP